MLGCYRLLFALCGDIGGLGEQARIVRAEQLRAKLHRRVDLRLTEGSFGRRRSAQPIQQNLHPAIEKILQIGGHAARRLADREFARVVPACGGEEKFRLGLGDVA